MLFSLHALARSLPSFLFPGKQLRPTGAKGHSSGEGRGLEKKNVRKGCSRVLRKKKKERKKEVG